MYRLPTYKDEVLQKVITSEMIRGFQFLFNIESQSEDNTKESINVLKDLLRYVDWSTYLSDEEWLQLFAKIQKMYKELTDTHNEYTFDEMGEFLLYKMIELVSVTMELCEEEWVLAATWFEQEYLKNFFATMVEGIEDDVDEEDKQQYIKDYIECLSFVNMREEGFCEELIFWDCDFLFFEHIKEINILLNNAESLGLTTGSEDAEPISGSLKFPIKQN